MTAYDIMLRAVVALLVIAACAGCMSMRPVDAPPEVLRDYIRDGVVVQPGDQIVVMTEEGEGIHVDVSSVDEDFIHGHQFPAKNVSVAIDEIVAMRKRDADVGRTILAAGGGYVVLVAAIAAMVFINFVDDLDEETNW